MDNTLLSRTGTCRDCVVGEEKFGKVTGSALGEEYSVRNVVSARAFFTILSDTRTVEKGQAYKKGGNEAVNFDCKERPQSTTIFV